MVVRKISSLFSQCAVQKATHRVLLTSWLLLLLVTMIAAEATPSPTVPAPTPTPAPPWIEACITDGLAACSPRVVREGGPWFLALLILISGFIWLMKSVFSGAGKSIEDKTKKEMDKVIDPAPKPASFDEIYLTAVIEDWREFKFRGANISARDIKPPELEKAYISLRLTPRLEKSDAEGERVMKPGMAEPERMMGKEAASQPVELAEAFKVSAKLAIIGPAGAGKSTLLQWAGLACARAILREKLLPEQKQFVEALGKEPLIPVLVTLRDFNYWCETENHKHPRTPDAFLDFMAYHFAQHHPALTLPAGYFEDVLGRGCLLMLDAVDELETDDRARVGEAIEGLLRNFHQQTANRFLLTSRPMGYFSPGQASDFIRCDVQRLEPAQRNALIEDWCRAIYPTDQAAAEASKLIKRIEEEGGSRLNEMASTPLMVTILALVQRDLGRLPHQRAELYEEAVRVLLTETYKEGEAVKTLQGWGGRLPDQRRNCLAPIAYVLQLEPERRHALRLGDLASRERVCKAFRAEQNPVEAAEAFIEKVAERGGLLDKADGEYGFFTHNMFREFLAGRYLAEEMQDQWQDVLSTRVEDNLWTEVILLAAGYLAIKSDEKANRFITLLAEKAGEGSPEKVAQALILACEAIADLPQKSVFLETKESVVQDALEMLQANPPVISPNLRADLGVSFGEVGDTRLHPGGLPDLVNVPAGLFSMGTSDQDEIMLSRQNVTIWPDEKPAHLVEITYDFQIARFPVTNAEFEAFLQAGGYDLQRCGDCWSDAGKAWRTGAWQPGLTVYPENYRKQFQEWLNNRPVEKRGQPFFWADRRFNKKNLPVVGVTWFEAEAYCNWLTRLLQSNGAIPDDHCFRLPTEAEWEHAARFTPAPLNSTDRRFFPWGDQWDAAKCNNAEAEPSLRRTSPVGAYPNGASYLGIQDLAGNVWEWCLDVFDAEIYTRRKASGEPVVDPAHLPADGARVLRGGSWYHYRNNARCASRNRYGPDLFFYHYVGFRPVLSPEGFEILNPGS
jgi:formylglycine-generating enzyme required for sulfatase activity